MRVALALVVVALVAALLLTRAEPFARRSASQASLERVEMRVDIDDKIILLLPGI